MGSLCSVSLRNKDRAVLGDAEHYGPAYGAAGGTLGTNLGSVAALIFLYFSYFLLICMSLSEE